jgi:ethanolamine transporter
VDLNQIIINLMVVFMVVAVLDKCIGSQFSLGNKLDEALDTIGPMCIPMVGMFLLAPVIGELLSPVVGPLFTAMKADPAMFAGTVLACDMGGYSLALNMAQDPQAGQLAGCILSCSLGGVISFTIPVGITMVKKENLPPFAIGVLLGIVTVPIGLLAGGLVMGCSLAMLLHNALPVLLISLIIAVGLWRAQKQTIFVFNVFGRALTAIAAIGFAIGIIQELTPVVILPEIASVLDGIRVVGSVAIVLCGAYPMLEIVNRVFGKSIKRVGSLMGIDQVATQGIIGGFANIMPILGSCNQMSPAGITVASAFAVSASCAFGDHLGFIASVDKTMLMPMIVSKLVGGGAAVLLAIHVNKKKS